MSVKWKNIRQVHLKDASLHLGTLAVACALRSRRSLLPLQAMHYQALLYYAGRVTLLLLFWLCSPSFVVVFRWLKAKDRLAPFRYELVLELQSWYC